MTRLAKVLWAFFLAASGSAVSLLFTYLLQGSGTPLTHELYTVVERHLIACRGGDYPLAYYAAASGVQERLSLVQFEHRLREDWKPLSRMDHVEFGAVRGVPGERERALVEVYFVLRRGEVVARLYSLVREDGDWKVAGSSPLAGWPADQRVRLSGLRL